LKLIQLYNIIANDVTCAGKSITGVSRITGTDEASRFVGTSGKFMASSDIHSTLIHVCVISVLQTQQNYVRHIHMPDIFVHHKRQNVNVNDVI